MGTQEMLRVITRHTLEVIFQVMEAAVKLSRRAKTIEKKIALQLEYFGHTTYLQRAHPDKLATASPGNPMQFMKPSLLFYLYNRIKSLCKSRQILKKPMFSQLSAKNPWEQFARSRNLHQHPLLHTLLNLLLKSSGTHHFDACLAR